MAGLHPDVAKRIKPKGVVTRKSTEIVAVENPAVVDALRFIQNNFSKGNLSVRRCGRQPTTKIPFSFSLQRFTTTDPARQVHGPTQAACIA
jgi:hypothetical protein